MIFKAAFVCACLAMLGSLTGEEVKPEYLYKILSMDNWDQSRDQGQIVLPAEDSKFIHLAKRDQLDSIVNKYWEDVDRFVILKIKTSDLKGDLVYETNPGGVNRYYHLYNGSIPLDALVEVKFINRAYMSPHVPKDF